MFTFTRNGIRTAVALTPMVALFAGCKHETPAPTAPAEPVVPAAAATASDPASRLSQKLSEPRLWDSVAVANQACDAHLARAEKFKQQIRGHKGKRGFADTLVPFNDLLIQIDRIQPLSELIANVHPDKAVRGVAEKCEQRAKKFISELKLDRTMFDALKGVDTAGLAPRAQRFVKLLLRDYRRAGVDRDEATRKHLAELDERLVKLGQEFDRNIREDKRFILVTEKELAGLPKDYVAARRKAAKGKRIKITTDYPDFYPLQAYASKEAVRRQLYEKLLTRAHPVNDKVLKELLGARHAYATALGYPDWAAYNAEDKMVKNKKVIADFLTKVVDLARPRMDADLKQILARKKKDMPKADVVGGWDRFYYVKKIQAEEYGVDPDEVRGYFEFGRVKQGLLALAQELFNVEFKRLPRAKVWHESVEAYDVYDGGKRVGRFYLDLHPREGKYGHAAEFPILSGVEGVQLPAAALVTNFPDPSKTGGEPALTEHNQVTTFFHEFGHLMHQLLAGRQRWVTQAGISCEWDFVEAPSQLMEEWTWDPKVLARFAVHHKTGKPIPAALVERMRKANEFGKGIHVMRQMFYAYLSFTYHRQDPAQLDLMAALKDVQKRYNPYPYVDGTAVFANFGHLNGYSSMYYTYMWSLVLAKDLFTMFEKNGLLDKATAKRYREAVLAPGGSKDAAEMVKDFLGRPYAFDAFQRWLQAS